MILNRKNDRIYWIDQLKAFGAFLVIIGHLPTVPIINKYIFSFHMPLFFLLTGYTFKFYENFIEFFIKKIKSIILPYFIFSFISYISWVVVRRHFGESASKAISIFKPLLGIFYSNGIDDWMIFNIPLWFLTCLFVTEIGLYFVVKYTKNTSMIICLIILGVVGFLDSLFIPIRLPWGIDVALTAIVFMGAGVLIKNKINYLSKFFYLKYALPLFIIGLIFAYLNYPIDMNSNFYGNLIFFYISCFCSIFFYIILFTKLPYISLLSYIGRNTIYCLSLHILIFSFLKAILQFIFKIPFQFLSNSMWYSLLFAITTYILLIPIYYIINTGLLKISNRQRGIK